MTNEEVTTSKGLLALLHPYAGVSLAEAARRLNITERELLLWKAEGHLAPAPFVFGIDLQGNSARLLLDRATLIALATSENSEAIGEVASLFDGFDVDDEMTVETEYGSLAYHRVRGRIIRLPEPTAVKLSDVRVFEVQIQYLENFSREADRSESPESGWEFDPDSDTYPEELDIANIAYRAVVKQRDPDKRPKQQVLEWLHKHYPKLSNEAKERIATVCNWRKAGGRRRGE